MEKLKELEIENRKLRETVLHLESKNNSNVVYQKAVNKEQTTPSLNKSNKQTRILSPTPQAEYKKANTTDRLLIAGPNTIM